MRVWTRRCRAICSIFLIISLAGCAVFDRDTSFEWLDVASVPRATTDIVFGEHDTFRDLASSYIQLKHECEATNFAVDELEDAQRALRRIR